jgi:thiol-disulfide isomerase/thioredoxin
MRKTFPLLLIALALSAHAAAQSGRRIAPQPAPPVTSGPPPPGATVLRSEAGGYIGTTPPPEEVAGYVPEAVLGREFQSLKDGSFKLSDFGGKVLVINLWASWCGPCRREIPEIEQIRREYESRGVEFVGLTAEDPQTDGERVRRFVRESRLGYRVGWIDRQSARALMRGHNMIPQTFVITGEGQIVKHLKGYAPGRTADMLRDAIERALPKKSGV